MLGRVKNHSASAEPVVLRLSGKTSGLHRLAALEGRELPEGPFLLAEVDGDVVAAAPLDGKSEPLADPFRPTADVIDLLAYRTRRLRSSGPYLRKAA